MVVPLTIILNRADELSHQSLTFLLTHPLSALLRQMASLNRVKRWSSRFSCTARANSCIPLKHTFTL